MKFEWQPELKNGFVHLIPLQENDFDKLYAVASDPEIWEQHPNKDRYKKEVFENYFRGAMESGGAFIIYDAGTGSPIGSSRFYEYNEKESSVLIGYTFLAKDHWGTTYNRAVKSLMLDHAFRFVDNVIFHIGAKNIRSQKAIERLGATKRAELPVTYYGETEQMNFEYVMRKEDWMRSNV